MNKHTSFTIVTICGSMHFYEDMLLYASNLTLSGCVVLMPFITGATGERKQMLDALHRTKIDMCTRILVINGNKNGHANYIGESTKNEIEYAIACGKEVEYAYE